MLKRLPTQTQEAKQLNSIRARCDLKVVFHVTHMALYNSAEQATATLFFYPTSANVLFMTQQGATFSPTFFA